MMLKRIFLTLSCLFVTGVNAHAEEYSERMVVLAGEDGDVDVTDQEVDDLVLLLENEGVVTENTDAPKAVTDAPVDTNTPYADLAASLDKYQVKGLDRDIIMGMVVNDPATNIFAGLMLFYVNLSNFLLHPLIVLFVAIIALLLIVTICLAVIRFKKDDMPGVKKYLALAGAEVILAVYLGALIYEDFLGFTIYKKYMMGILFVSLSVVIGFVLGNVFSKFYFEDKVLP